ncbi:MAG: hypothetical protein KF764_25475 [Labilithrix sp.]|nr:hypothetical protein [Labilithrix sp.]
MTTSPRTLTHLINNPFPAGSEYARARDEYEKSVAETFSRCAEFEKLVAEEHEHDRQREVGRTGAARPTTDAAPPLILSAPMAYYELVNHQNGTLTLAFEPAPPDGRRFALFCTRENAMSLADFIRRSLAESE